MFYQIYNFILDVSHSTKCQTVEDIFAAASGSSQISRCCYIGGFGVVSGSVILGHEFSDCFVLSETVFF